jgi:CheY-like chemotaxis protein
MLKTQVLVVDNEELYCQTIRESLTPCGIDVSVAPEAASAGVLLRLLKPALLIIDVRMKGLDGMDTVRRLRQQPKWSGVPVIVASTFLLKTDQEAAIQAGADAYLSKPFSAKELRLVLRRFIDLPRTGSLGARDSLAAA